MKIVDAKFLASQENIEGLTKIKLRGVCIDSSVNKNKWQIPSEDLASIASQSVGKQIRVDHSQNVRDVKGVITFTEVDEPHEDAKAEWDLPNKFPHIHYEADLVTNDYNVILPIMHGFVDHVSIGLESKTVFCSECGEKYITDGTFKPEKPCDCEGAWQLVKEANVNEYSIVVQPAYEGAVFVPYTASRRLDMVDDKPVIYVTGDLINNYTACSSCEKHKDDNGGSEEYDKEACGVCDKHNKEASTETDETIKETSGETETLRENEGLPEGELKSEQDTKTKIATDVTIEKKASEVKNMVDDEKYDKLEEMFTKLTDVCTTLTASNTAILDRLATIETEAKEENAIAKKASDDGGAGGAGGDKTAKEDDEEEEEEDEEKEAPKKESKKAKSKSSGLEAGVVIPKINAEITSESKMASAVSEIFAFAASKGVTEMRG